MANRMGTSFMDGWRVMYKARSVFAIILLIAMVINIAIFAVAYFRPSLITETTSITSPTTQTADQTAGRQKAISMTMSICSLAAGVSIVFLLFCALLGVMMIIAGNMPGAGSAAGAFFWSVAMIVLMLPWCPFAMKCAAGMQRFSELTSEISKAGTTMEKSMLWGHYLVYPLIIILFTIIYLSRTARANELINEVPYTETRV